jgi:hypothetical protein
VIHPDRAFVVLQIQMVAGQQAGLSPGKKRVGAKPATNRPMSTKRSGLVPGLSALDPVGEGLALSFQLDRPRWGYLGSDRADFVGFFQWTSSARSAPKRHSHHRSCSCRKPNDPSYLQPSPRRFHIGEYPRCLDGLRYCTSLPCQIQSGLALKKDGQVSIKRRWSVYLVMATPVLPECISPQTGRPKKPGQA